MKILVEGNWVHLLMRDGHYFELEMPSQADAIKLKTILELAIVDTIEQLNLEGQDGPICRDR